MTSAMPEKAPDQSNTVVVRSGSAPEEVFSTVGVTLPAAENRVQNVCASQNGSMEGSSTPEVLRLSLDACLDGAEDVETLDVETPVSRIKSSAREVEHSSNISSISRQASSVVADEIVAPFEYSPGANDPVRVLLLAKSVAAFIFEMHRCYRDRKGIIEVDDFRREGVMLRILSKLVYLL